MRVAGVSADDGVDSNDDAWCASVDRRPRKHVAHEESGELESHFTGLTGLRECGRRRRVGQVAGDD
jgi:hypothetical protein